VSRLHKMREIPAGQSVGDLLPAFAEVEHAVHLGEPNKGCPGCRKPFTAARKPRRSITVYPVGLPLPIAFAYRICGGCLAEYRKGGEARDAMLAAIDAYIDGAEATQ
jgi:hypothetical protein